MVNPSLLLFAAFFFAACSSCSGGSGASADSGGTTGPDLKRTEAGLPPQGDAGLKNPHGKIFYVRPGGGTSQECTGLVDKDYPGSGSSKACAFSHPFVALPPKGGKALLSGGDWLIIANGSYRMGINAPGASRCEKASSYDCDMPPIPAGPAKDKPTRILGAGYGSGCKTRPQLYGVERAWRVLDLTNSSNVELNCLEITDHSGCVEDHSGSLRCKRSGSGPYGDWSPTGIYAQDANNVTLKKVDIHGMAHHGMLAGRLRDWTFEDVRIAANGWVGFDGDLGSNVKDSANSGTMLFRRLIIAWSGCGETYPGKKPSGCWGQGAGGYGDGLGTASTGGDWIFEDSRFTHNVSDGLDLLYHERGGKIVLRRCHAEGNAGNQIKVSGKDLTIENSVMVGNCAYFQGKSFTHKVDDCRALGNTLGIGLAGGTRLALTNNTLYGNGDVLITAEPRVGSCNGSEKLTALNNIFLGGKDHHQPGEMAALSWIGSCSGLSLSADYSVTYGVKGTCKIGSNDKCADPKLGPLSGDAYGMIPKTGSPALDTGLKVGGAVPDHDFNKQKRPKGKGVDRGAFEVQ